MASFGRGRVRRPRRPDPPPLETNEVRIITIGTLLWLAAFIAFLPFRARLEIQGHGWWLWTCLAGFGMGVWGISYVRRRRHAIERARALPPRHDQPDYEPDYQPDYRQDYRQDYRHDDGTLLDDTAPQRIVGDDDPPEVVMPFEDAGAWPTPGGEPPRPGRAAGRYEAVYPFVPNEHPPDDLDEGPDPGRFDAAAYFVPPAADPPESPPYGFMPPGFEPQGFEPQGYEQPGYEQPGFAPETFEHEVSTPQGFVPGSYGPDAYEPNAYEPNAYGQDAYEPPRPFPEPYPESFPGSYDYSTGELVPDELAQTPYEPHGYAYPYPEPEPEPFYTPDYGHPVPPFVGDEDPAPYRPTHQPPYQSLTEPPYHPDPVYDPVYEPTDQALYEPAYQPTPYFAHEQAQTSYDGWYEPVPADPYLASATEPPEAAAWNGATRAQDHEQVSADDPWRDFFRS